MALLLSSVASWAAFGSFDGFETDLDSPDYAVTDANPFDDPPAGVAPLFWQGAGEYRSNNAYGLVEEAPSGTRGITSASGNAHAEVYPIYSGGVDTWHNNGGSSNTAYSQPYSFRMDVYLDPSWTRRSDEGMAGGEDDFQIRNSVNDTSGNQLAEGVIRVNVTDANHDSQQEYNIDAGASSPLGSLFTTTTPGWYTLEQTFSVGPDGPDANSDPDILITTRVWDISHTTLIASSTIASENDADGSALAGDRSSSFYNVHSNIAPFIAIDNVGVGEPLSANALSLQFDKSCYKPGDTAVVTLAMSALDTPAAGYQAFLNYDNGRLSWVSTDLTGAPFGRHILTGTPDGSGNVDVSAGIDLPAQSPTSAAANLATLTFTVTGASECSAAGLVSFRTNNPETLISDANGDPLVVTTTDANQVTIDADAPQFDPGTPATVTLECANALDTSPSATGTPLITDNCSASPSLTYQDSAQTADCGNTYHFTRTWTATDCAGNAATFDQTIQVSDTTAPEADAGSISACYPDIATAEAAAIAATTASDTCGDVTLSAATSGECNATIAITATDACGNTSVVHYYTRIDGLGPVVTISADITANADAGLCTASINPGQASATDNCQTLYSEGFEGPGWAVDTWAGWNGADSSISAVSSGTDSIASASGAFHAVIDSSGAQQTGAFTRLGGFMRAFCNGFTTSVDVYIDLNNPSVAAATYGFDLTSEINNQSGAKLRDFVFHVAADDNTAPGHVLIAADNTAGAAKRNDLETGNHFEIAASGWYRFQWVFRDASGVLSADLNLLDSGGTPLWSATLSDPSDLIASAVGGNGALRLSYLAVDKLAIDNTLMSQPAPAVTVVRREDGLLLSDPYPIGVTHIDWSAADCCGNTTTLTQTVTVNNAYTVEIPVRLKNVSENVVRTIRFDFGGAGEGLERRTINVPVTFTAGVGTAQISTLDACSGAQHYDWTCVSAKDEQHTLRSTAALTVSGTKYVADFTQDAALVGGDATNDNLIDIRDFGVFAGQYGSNPPLDTAWPVRNANFSCNLGVGTDDYTFIAAGFLHFGNNLCSGGATLASIPLLRASYAQLRVAGVSNPEVADVNRDGIVDMRDVSLFLQRNRRR